MRNLETACGVAAQIVFEYPGWGDEHVSDMYNTYRDCGEKPPCSGDELMDLTVAAERLKKSGLTYSETEKELMKQYLRKK